MHTKKNRSTKKKNTSTLKSYKSIKIISYNISWESMSGSVKDWTLCSNNTNPNNPKHNSVCVNNIAQVFQQDFLNSISKYNNNDIDFITLQESSDFKKLIELSPQLKKMNYEAHNSSLDVITTFWMPKYKLLHTIKGEFEKGRPWMATIFNNGNNGNNGKNIICLINVHFGHYKYNEEYRKMEKMLFTIKEEILIQKYIVNRFIISGDFNYNIKEFGNSNKNIIINGTKFYYNPKNILTCCIKRKKHYDHIIDSMAKPINIIIPKVKYMASDHKPILGELVN